MRFDQFLKEVCPPLDLEWRKYRRRDAKHRVEKRMEELGLPDYATYLERIRCDTEEAASMAERMRVTVSRFFREWERWETLRQAALPRILLEKGPGEPLRIWSAGCCGGEEPYTLAILWLEHFCERGLARPVEILGTDIDAASLERARLAIYGKGSVREIPRPLLQKYFRKEDRLWHLDERVKRMVRFAKQDLMHSAPPQRVDLVCCRYLVFTYYRETLRFEAAMRLRQALRPGGLLMIARKEELGSAAELFEPLPEADGVFRKREFDFP
ncbi:MAG: protein-glutamate O-methyltransferase CheR [Desulfuromonadales bacterium]|nr:protein-glutamate O-methyltransferase CheR [Desulfuromonadales bacterium]